MRVVVHPDDIESALGEWRTRGPRVPSSKMSPETVEQIVKSIESKDLSTAAHTWRVVLYLRAMCEEHGIGGERLLIATHGAALHDLGKLDIPDAILQKPGSLTDDEFSVIKRHPEFGHKRLLDMNVTEEPILNVVRHHHERWDGLGYPDRIKGESIPLIARMFAVIDTFDALTSIRPYRREIGEEAANRALDILIEDKGTHYWPEAVDMFVDLYRSGRLDYILHHFNDKADLPAFGSADANGTPPGA
jgi:HD-GYP domain-containing protein (c-di-GMP phosphodiesterase class II)